MAASHMKNYFFSTLLFIVTVFILNSNAIADVQFFEQLWINTNNKATITSSKILENRVSYLIEIEGTHSYWESSAWEKQHDWQGVPEDEPMFIDESPINYFVGADASFNFACPNIYGCKSDEIPKQQAFITWSIDNGNNWYTSKAVEYNQNHLYQFINIGQGYQIRFNFDDGHYTDNYGKYKITIKTLTSYIDSDNDGITEQFDECPNTPINSFVDKKGCPPDGIFITQSHGIFITQSQASQIVNCMKSVQTILDTIGLEDAIRALEISAGVEKK